MFTRHFYEVDEVIAALHWSIKLGRLQEAVFWTQELLDSELQDTLQDELYTIWLWHFGVGCLSALSLLFGNENPISLVSGLTRLPTHRRDRSVLTLLILGLETKQPDRHSFFPHLEPLLKKFQCSDLERAFVSAVYQGKARLAFGLSRPIKQTRIYTLLQQIQEVKHNCQELADALSLLEVYDKNWIGRACAIAAVCLTKKQLKESLQPLNLTILPETEVALKEWNILEGRRKRRVFKIPPEAIYKRTERGRMSNKETNLEVLYTLNYETLEGCPFWNRVLEEEAPWLEDDRKEEFYDLYFPDDIPDEWSREDQEKSHGYGSLINNEVPNEAKYRDRWFRGVPTRTYWFLNRDLQKEKEIDDWEKAYEKPWDEIVSTWCLTPVKKRVLVLESETAS